MRKEKCRFKHASVTIQEILYKKYSRYKLSPLDLEILLSLAIAKTREHIFAHSEKKLSPIQIKKYNSFVKRRIAGEPIAYITGKKEFFGLEFSVDENVLIPRPETELLVERAVEKIKNAKCDIFDAVIDVGTGSGNIIISIAKNIPNKIRKNINFFAVDVSRESLQVAKKNAKKHMLDKKIKFIQSNMLKYFLAKNHKLKNALIIANLPYVSPKIYQKNKGNLKFEPKKALFSQNSGLTHYIKLFEQVKLLITEHCSLILEISPEQKTEIANINRIILPKSEINFYKDLARKWRMAEIGI